MTTIAQSIRILALVLGAFVLAFTGGCRFLSAGVATPIVSRTIPAEHAAQWPTGLVINTEDTRLEVHIFPRARCISGPGCLLELTPTNQLLVRQQPLLRFFMDSSVPEVVRMGGRLTVQPVVLTPGSYTALYCASYASQFGCGEGRGLGVANFDYHPGHFVQYQPYPYDQYLYTKVVTLPWRLDIGVSSQRPLRDFVGFWVLFDLTCVREPWLCRR